MLTKNQIHRLLVFLVTATWLVLPVHAVQNSEFAEVRALAQRNAPGLALYTLDQLQPDVNDDATGWMAWEKERIRIYQYSNDWQGLATRLEKLPPELPETFRRWAMTERADALINLGQTYQAQLLLQRLIWTVPLDQPGSEQWLIRWRRMVMNSYLASDAVNDAYLASARFYRDYGTDQLDDRLLRARILLSDGYPEDAADLLKRDLKDPQASTLHLLALLRSKSRPPRKIVQAGRRKMDGKWPDESLKTTLWAVIAEAAIQSDDHATAALALEHAIAANRDTPLPEGLFDINADSLWQAYLDYAQLIGNKSHYLIGQDEPWFKAAQKARKKYPVRSRTIYAGLMVNGENDANRDKAAMEFINSAKSLPQGTNLLRELFLESDRFQDYREVPLAARYVLVDVALGSSDIKLASDLMATIQTPPKGTDRYFWELRRARIFVLGGDTLRSVAALQDILKTHKELDRDQFDRYLQVVFDLQTVGANQDAYQLFVEVMKRTDDDQLKRELFYWMAESRKAEKAYAEAARLYLKSAMYPDPKAMGPWAQTAHYQAAEALTQAGMVEDARNLYQALLKVTKDPGRRAVLSRELQKLWLIQQ